MKRCHLNVASAAQGLRGFSCPLPHGLPLVVDGHPMRQRSGAIMVKCGNSKISKATGWNQWKTRRYDRYSMSKKIGEPPQCFAWVFRKMISFTIINHAIRTVKSPCFFSRASAPWSCRLGVLAAWERDPKTRASNRRNAPAPMTPMAGFLGTFPKKKLTTPMVKW